MPRLLIAHSSEFYAQMLARSLAGQYEICVCCDGAELVGAVDSFLPDILLLSASICRKDALSVLWEISHAPRFILVITNYLSSYTQRRLCNLGAHHVLLMPSADTICSVLKNCLDEPEPAPSAEHLTQIHLRKLKLPYHLEGFDQICTAVALLLQTPNQTLSKHIYPTVAQVHRISDQRAVEHSIRGCIQAGWKEHDDAIWANYFPANPDGQIPCPTNRQFLSALAMQVRQVLLKAEQEPEHQSPSGHG